MPASALFRALGQSLPRMRKAQRFTLIFIHIPKTAGISLRQVLLERYRRRPRFRILHPADDLAQLASLPQDRRNALELIEGHMYYGVHEHIQRECRYITMLRDPVERVLSWYSYVRSQDWHHLYDRIARGNMSLTQCLRQGISIELDNHMVRTLAGQQYIHLPFGHVTSAMLEEAIANLNTFAAIGISEEFDRSLALFARTFEWRRPQPRHANATTSRIARRDIDGETLTLIESHNELDRRLYQYARELFARRSAANL